MHTLLTPAQPDGLGRLELLSNGVTVLRCGEAVEAIRAPYAIGITAYAYLRWAAGNRGAGGRGLGGVLADRRRHVYFLLSPIPPCRQPAVATAVTHCAPRLRLLGAGAVIVLPLPGSRMLRWLHGDHGVTADVESVVQALRIAHRKHVTQVRLRQAALVHEYAAWSRLLAALR